jgi:hypothetical protein
MLLAFHSSISQTTAVDPGLLVALSLADRGIRTLLLDVNIEPTAPTVLLENRTPQAILRPCYGDVLQRTHTVSDAIVRCSSTGLCVMRGGAVEEELRYDSVRQLRLAEIGLLEQIEAARRDFDLTILLLPDRFPPEVGLLLRHADGMVMVLDPSYKGCQGFRFYVERRKHESNFALVPLVGALIHGRDEPEPGVAAFFAQRLGSTLFSNMVHASWNEHAVFSGTPIERLCAGTRDAMAMETLIEELLNRLRARGEVQLNRAINRSASRPPLSLPERDVIHQEFMANADAFFDSCLPINE